MELTNILITALIALVGGIAKIFYDKFEVFSKKFEALLINEVKHDGNIQQLRKEVDDHEERISEIEKDRNNHSHYNE